MIILAKHKHLKKINDIYNQAVEDGLRTAHTSPVSFIEREGWFSDHSKKSFPVYVFKEEDDDEILGWLSISPYRSDRQALAEVVEVSYYVDYAHHGKGIASKLMEHAINFCKDANYRVMVAILVNSNEPSIALLNKFDFKKGGCIPNAIHFGGKFYDHLYMYKNLN